MKKSPSRFSAAHFAGLTILLLVVGAAALVVTWLMSRPEITSVRGPDAGSKLLSEITSQIQQRVQSRAPDEPRALDEAPIPSFFSDPAEMSLPLEAPAEFTAQTRETLRLRYNLGILKSQEGDTVGALAAFRSVHEIDPQGAYGRRAFIQMGMIHDRAGEYDRAVENFRKAVALDELDPIAAHNLGIGLLHAGKNQEAATELARAAKLDPANKAILQNLGNAYAVLNQDDLAEKSYRAALAIDDKNAPVQFNLGLALFRRGDYEGAAAEFDKAIPSLEGKDRARALGFLGLAQYRRGLLDEAAASFARASEIEPANTSYRFNQAVAHAKARSNLAAASAFQKVLDIAPDDAEAWFGLGGAYYLAERRNDALAAYQKGLAIDSSATGPLFTVGFILYEKGDLAAAEEKFRRVIEIGGPDASRAHVNLGLIYEARGQLAEAEKEYAAGDPKDPRTFYNLGLVRRRLGKISEAVEAFEQARTLKADEPKYVAALGDAYLEIGRPEAAIEAYNKAVETGNNDFEILIRLAQLSVRLERLREAESWIDRSIAAARTPRQKALAWLTRGLFDDRRGDVASALRSLENAQASDPAFTDVFYNKGVILARILRYDEAVDALRTALRLNPAHAPSHTQLGNIFAARGLKDEAIREYEAAVRIDSAAVEANFNLRQLQTR